MLWCSDGLVFFENLPYEAQNLDSAGPESLRQLDVEVCQSQRHCQFTLHQVPSRFIIFVCKIDYRTMILQVL